MEMDAIAAVVIGGTPLTGGKAKIIGTLFGCLLVGVINNGLNLLQVSINWQIIAKGLMILGAVLIDTQMSKFLARQVIQQARKV
jgi:ribose transport system permease protein